MFTATLLLAVGCLQASDGVSPAPTPIAERQCGVSWVAGGPITKDNINTLVAAGVTWIVQTPFGWQRDATSPKITLVTSGQVFWGETDEGLTVTTRLARERGIKSLLKPHIWLRDQSRGWRGEIHMATEQDWQTWFADYRRFILHYAKLAETLGIEAFCIGTELHRPVRERPDDWRRLIAEIRTVYNGKLTYGANWYNEFEQVPFWDQLDYIGIHGYFPLSDDPAPTLADLTRGWAQYLPRIERVQQRFDKPVLFTELGYRSVMATATKPWEWPRRGEAAGVDLDLQARCYEAFFETFWDKPWCAGVYFWKWYPRHASSGGPQNADFTPQNKPAQRVMTEWFRRDPD